MDGEAAEKEEKQKKREDKKVVEVEKNQKLTGVIRRRASQERADGVR